MLPALTAVAIASGSDTFSWSAAAAALAGVALSHLGMNLADDLFDYKVHSGETRERLAADGIRARIAKYPYLTSGQATIKQLKTAICVMLAAAAAAGAMLTIMRGATIVWMALAGLDYRYLLFRSAAAAGIPRTGRGSDIRNVRTAADDRMLFFGRRNDESGNSVAFMCSGYACDEYRILPFGNGCRARQQSRQTHYGACHGHTEGHDNFFRHSQHRGRMHSPCWA